MRWYHLEKKSQTKLILKCQKVRIKTSCLTSKSLNLINLCLWGNIYFKNIHFCPKKKKVRREPNEKIKMKYHILTWNHFKILLVERIKWKSKHSRTDNTIEQFLISTGMQFHFNYNNSIKGDLSHVCSCVAQCIFHPLKRKTKQNKAIPGLSLV